MRFQIVSAFVGVGRQSKKPFCRVGAMLLGANGQQYVEFFYDTDNATPVVGKVYDAGVEAYPNRQTKELVIRVAQLREVPAVAAAKDRAAA